MNATKTKATGAARSTEIEQGDLFLCELANWPVKDDMASMEFQLFSLAKNIDTQPREMRRGNRVVRVIPSAVGCATQFDKDLLLYIGSQLVEARNNGMPVSRTVEIESSHFLRATDRSDGGASYERIIDMLRRLRGTTLETNIPTGVDKITQTDGFAMIESYRVLHGRKRSTTKLNRASGQRERFEMEQVFRFTVTISEWLYNALVNYEVLTLDRGYFKLSRAIDRRLYEIARKHCGDQPLWKINLDLLAEKLGSSQERFRLREDIRRAIEADELPQYRVALDTSTQPDDVVFYTRDSRRLSVELLRIKGGSWFQDLERSDNVAKWNTPGKGQRERVPTTRDLPLA